MTNKKEDENFILDNDDLEDKNFTDDLSYINEDASDEDKISKIKKLKKKIANCQAEKEAYLDGWQRSKADYANLKRRSEEDKKAIRSYGIENMVCELLPVIDNFEIAFKDGASWNQAPENWRSGVEIIYNQMIKTLESNGVKQIDPLGKLFDPEIHHSIEIVEVSDMDKDDKIVEVQQKGYFLHDKNIRPAMVKVGKFNIG